MNIPILRRRLWRRTVDVVREFTEGGEWVLVIGRPSFLALHLVSEGGATMSCYDAMDDFPEFYGGLSRFINRRVEMEIARRADCIVVSSTGLKKKFNRLGFDVELMAQWRGLCEVASKDRQNAQ